MTTPVTDTVVLDRTFAVSAYWDARAADPTTCARQVLRLLTNLTALEPTFEKWRREDGTVESAPLPGDPEELGAQMLLETRDAGIGSGVTGYFVADGIAVSVRLGMTDKYSGNAVVLKPGNQPKPVWLAKAPALIKTLVDVFDPEWAILGPSAYRRAQKNMANPDVGAVTYLTGNLRAVDIMPVTHLSQYGSGSLLDLTDNGQRLPTISEVLEVRGALFPR